MQVTKREARPYVSGWCGTRDHHRCRGEYGAPCTCLCHDRREAARLAQAERMRAEWASAR